MDQREAITIARQAIKLAQYEELIEVLQTELQRRVALDAEAENKDEENVEVEGDFDIATK